MVDQGSQRPWLRREEEEEEAETVIPKGEVLLGWGQGNRPEAKALVELLGEDIPPRACPHGVPL